jgi:hypothetical protein
MGVVSRAECREVFDRMRLQLTEAQYDEIMDRADNN